MPSAETMLFAHQRALTAVRGAGNAGLPETLRLTEATTALLDVAMAAERKRDEAERDAFRPRRRRQRAQKQKGANVRRGLNGKPLPNSRRPERPR